MISLFVYPFLISLFTLMAIIYFSHKHDLFIDDAEHDKPQNYHSTQPLEPGG